MQALAAVSPGAAGPPPLRQKAIRCQPSGRTQARGRALKVPTNRPLKATAFQPWCRRDLTGNRSGTRRTSAKGASSTRNSPIEYFLSTGASSCSSATFMTFDSAFSHEIRL